MKKKVYLAGAMGCYGDDFKQATEWRNKAKKWFKVNTDNFRCISPTDYFLYGGDNFTNEFEVMRFDLKKLKESDIVLANLKDLDKSIGTSDEILYAYLHDIPVIGFLETTYSISYNEKEAKDIAKIIHPWKYIQINRIEYSYNAMEDAMKYINEFYG